MQCHWVPAANRIYGKFTEVGTKMKFYLDVNSLFLFSNTMWIYFKSNHKFFFF